MKTNLALFGQLDSFLERCGVKYIFIESGFAATKNKCDEAGIDTSNAKMYWCELSWGSGVNEEDEFDFAFNDFGDTLGQAIQACLDAFIENKGEEVLRAKNKFGWRM